MQLLTMLIREDLEKRRRRVKPARSLLMSQFLALATNQDLIPALRYWKTLRLPPPCHTCQFLSQFIFYDLTHCYVITVRSHCLQHLHTPRSSKSRQYIDIPYNARLTRGRMGQWRWLDEANSSNRSYAQDRGKNLLQPGTDVSPLSQSSKGSSTTQPAHRHKVHYFETWASCFFTPVAYEACCGDVWERR